MTNCSICDELKGEIKSNDKRYMNIVKSKKIIIYSTENFIVLPSIGALNKTHILIVPKEHDISFANISKEHDIEIGEIKDKLNNFNKKEINKNLIFFEHGMGKTCSTSGSCVSHAHIHGIMEIDDFSEFLFDNINMHKLFNYNELHNSTNKFIGYIFYEDINKNYWIANNPNVKSQYFRKIYNKVNKSKLDWNWRNNPNFDGILEVINYYNKKV